MAAPNEHIPGATIIECVQTATIGPGLEQDMSPEWDWRDDNVELEVLYGIITSGTLTDLDVKLFSNKMPISGDDFVPLELYVFESPPERPNVNLVGIILSSRAAKWKPRLKNTGGSQQSVTIVWRALQLPRSKR